MENPKVSIIIPVYNGSNYLAEAIDSALAQDYDNFEVIVINDGSNDNGLTEGIALSYASKIRYYKKKNGGVASALNYGINQMKGDYFSWLSHDDIYQPQKISSQIEMIKKTGDPMTIVYSGYKLVDENLKLIESINFKRMYSEEKLNRPLFPLFKGLINGCSLLINKNYFNKSGLFDEQLKTTQDYDMWYKVLKTARIIYQEDIYVLSRFHSDQGSKNISSHYEESNNLWIKMISSLDKQEMINIEGSPYLFYYQTAKFLKRNRLLIAYDYVILKQKLELKNSSKKVYIEKWLLIPLLQAKAFYYKLRRAKGIFSERGLIYLIDKIRIK